MSRLHIGLDLDNTIIDYDRVFAEAGVDIGLLDPDQAFTTKEEVKEHLRAGPCGDEAWMRLQGQVYGRFIGKARLFPGVRDFLETVRSGGARVSIVSHKTRYGHFDPDRINLWEAALGWLKTEGIFASEGIHLQPSDIRFLETRAEKIATISAIGCDLFVDDLSEVLNDARFPAAVQKIWFAPAAPAESGQGLRPHRTWDEITAAVAKSL